MFVDYLGLLGVEWLSLRLVWSCLVFEHFFDEVFIRVKEKPYPELLISFSLVINGMRFNGVIF